MLRRTIWSVSPLAAGEVTALSSVRASVWPREAAPHTGQQTSGRGFRRHGWPKGRGVLLRRGRARSQEQGCIFRCPRSTWKRPMLPSVEIGYARLFTATYHQL